MSMKKVVHRSEERGKGEYGWLKTRHSFSFGTWYNPDRTGFGKLLVINDDRIAPASGFEEHAHQNMEIITIVTKGALTHKDSIGNVGTIHKGDVQVMSAGIGVTHAEFNEQEHEDVELFQIWIQPSVMGIVPRYAQKTFSFANVEEGMLQLVEPTGKEGLAINQNAYITYTALIPGTPAEYQLHEKDNGVYIFIIEGEANIAGEELKRRDAIGVEGTEFVTLSSSNGGKLLIIEVPMDS